MRKIFISSCLILLTLVVASYAGNKLDVIVIDAGHGGKDPGTMGVNGSKEKNINLSIALKLGDLIQKKFPDIKIIYTRSTDNYLEVHDRTVIANKNKAKLFISIHCNHKKEEESEKKGFEIYLLNMERMPEAIGITLRENMQLKYQQATRDTTSMFIYNSLVENGYLKFTENLSSLFELNLLDNTTLESRGIMQAGFWVLLGASMPSVLVETGYLSDANDEKYLSSDEGQQNFAKALLEGFSEYKLLYEMN